MYRFSANSRATISSTAIFLSQQSRQYFSSPRGSDTSLAPHSAQRVLTTALRDISLEFIACGNRGLEAGCQHPVLLLRDRLPLERGRVHPLGVFLEHPARG